MPLSGHQSNGKTHGELKNSKVGYFLAGLMGHTFMTHSYLFDSNRDRPECNQCNKTLTISHVLLECPKYHVNRILLIQLASDLGFSLSLPLLLGNDYPALLDLLCSFLEQGQILHVL